MNLTKNLAEGEIIFHEGSLSDCAYIIGAGSIEIYTTTAQGKKTLGTLGENEIFGEMGLIDGLPRSATARACETSVIFILTAQTFEQLIHKKPQALLPILKILTHRLRETMIDLKKGYKHREINRSLSACDFLRQYYFIDQKES
jgi:CRP-like cAMP-binding protein